MFELTPETLQSPAFLALAVGGLALFSAGIAADAVVLSLLLTRRPCWKERVSALRERPWEWYEGFAFLLLLLGVRVILAMLSASDEPPTPLTSLDPHTVLSALTLSTVSFHGLGLALILATLVVKHTTWRHAFGFSTDTPMNVAKQGLLGYLAVMPPVLAAATLVSYTMNRLGIDPTAQPAVELLQKTDSPAILLFMAVLAVAVAPFVEESLFRGVGLTALLKHFGLGTTCFLVSVVFAAVHMHLPSFLPIFVLAMGLSLAYVYTGNLLVPIVMHTAFNAVNLSFALLVRGLPHG